MNVSQRLFFKFSIMVILSLLAYCLSPVESGNEFTFAVVDVGEGLAQIGTINNRAIIWDIGPIDGYQNFLNAYRMLGSPCVEMLIISHSDLDHCGGLTLIDSAINWNGKMVVNPYEDTAYLRALLHNWKGEVSFSTIHQEDSLQVEGLVVNCLWPPENLAYDIDSSGRNFTSLVFTARFGRTVCMITSDIDSIAQKQIALDTFDLHSDIFIVPHHGSNNFSPLFIQYNNPTHIVISCSKTNSYGHPSQELLKYLITLKSALFFTFSDGTCTFLSNEFYWSRK